VARLPIKTIYLNKSPVVVGNLKALSPAMAERWGIDVAQAVGRAEAAAKASAALAGLWSEVFERPKAAQPVDVDEDLYGGFVGHTDRGRLQRLRELPPEQLALKRSGFDDARLEEIVFRYRARNFPETLGADERERWEQHRAARLHGGVDGAMTVEVFFERIDALSEAADENGQEILAALYDWAEQIGPER
jgi:exodeoxyribonuclease-1